MLFCQSSRSFKPFNITFNLFKIPRLLSSPAKKTDAQLNSIIKFKRFEIVVNVQLLITMCVGFILILNQRSGNKNKYDFSNILILKGIMAISSDR